MFTYLQTDEGISSKKELLSDDMIMLWDIRVCVNRELILYNKYSICFMCIIA